MNTYLNHNKINQLPFITKLFVWSIIFEPLNYFIAFEPHFAGVGGNISRLMQLIVLITLLSKKMIGGRALYIHNPFSFLSKYYTFYLMMALFAGIYGVLVGAYDLGHGVDFISEHSKSTWYSFINGLMIRPFVEYFIQFYYFFYFVILSYYLLSNEDGLNYFFKIFKAVFLVCLALGFLDLLVIYFSGDYLLSRHFYEDRGVGFRFHGIAGEPRHAFAYLMLAISIFYLKETWVPTYKVKTTMIVIVLVAMMLTQSASGMMGLLFGGVFVLIFYNGATWKRLFFSIVAPIALVLVFYEFSDRVQLYTESAIQVYQGLNGDGEIPKVFRGQMRDVYPVWQRFLEIKNFDFIGTIFGTGFLSETVLVNRFADTTSFNLTPPSSQLVRTFYSVGIVGMILLTYAFIHPLKIIINSRALYKKYLFFVLILLGGFFAQRASVIYIYLGILVALFKCLSLKNNELAIKSDT